MKVLTKMTQETAEKPLTEKQIEQKIKDVLAKRVTEKKHHKLACEKVEKLVNRWVALKKLPTGDIMPMPRNPVDIYYKCGITAGLTEKEANLGKHYYKNKFLDFPKR